MGPIRFSATVRRSAAEAFELFTERIGEWWPLHQGFSYGDEHAEEVHLEPVAGGRFYERYTDGQEFEVGRVLICEPPRRIVFTWQGGWSAPTEVEVRFIPEGPVTRVDLEHRGWERLAASGERHRTAFMNGWPTVFGRYREAAGAVEAAP
jgi:uncharacterized protein YndB with AHSA1/START domain